MRISSDRLSDTLILPFRFCRAAVRRFYRDHCLRHAAGLAYTTLLSLVPLFALMFAVLKGLGVQRRLEPLLLSRLALDPDTTRTIIGYIDRTNVSTLGALGAAALFLTVVSVLGSVESSFNSIWRVHRNRSLWRKTTDYLSALMLVPFLLLVGVAITSSARSHALLSLLLQTEYVGNAVLAGMRLAPVLINAIAIGMMYSIMPNRRPHFPSVALAALVAGALWQGVQISYVSLQIGVARYSAIYGALSQLPVTLVWLYVSWVVILAGAEVAAVSEFGVDAESDLDRPASPWAVAAHLLLRAAQAFHDGGAPLDPKRVARELQMEGGALREVADRLRDAGFLAEVDGPAYVLAREPALIDLATLDAIVDMAMVPPGCDPRIRLLLDRLAADRIAAWKGHTLADLMAAKSPMVHSGRRHPELVEGPPIP